MVWVVWLRRAMNRHDRFENFPIGPRLSNRIESEQPIGIESNLEASQVPRNDTKYCSRLNYSCNWSYAAKINAFWMSGVNTHLFSVYLYYQQKYFCILLIFTSHDLLITFRTMRRQTQNLKTNYNYTSVLPCRLMPKYVRHNFMTYEQ